MKMENLNAEIKEILERTANNCEFYKKEGKRDMLVNEAGCLRGVMYAADAIGIEYPKLEFYNKYIKPVYDEMK